MSYTYFYLEVTIRVTEKITFIKGYSTYILMETKNLVIGGLFIIGIFVIVTILGGVIESSITGNIISNEKSNPEDIETKLKDETLVIGSGDIYYYGGNYKLVGENRKYHYIVSSSQPVDIYVVLSESDWRLIGTGQTFKQYQSCRGINTLRYDRECTIDRQGGIAILNKNKDDVIVTMQVYQIV